MSETAYEFGPFRLDPLKRVLTCEGRDVGLTPKTFDVLRVLVENRGRALDKNELMRAVWPDTVVEENNLARNISVLRKALGAKAGDHEYVVTIPGTGYRFVAPVREVALLAEPQASGEAPAEEPAIRPIRRARAAAMALMAVLGLALAGLGWHVWRGRARSAGELRSLAVLPFDNLSGPDQEYLAEGMTDVLIAELTGIRSLRVISRQSVIRYKESKEPLPQIARALGVDAVVEGTALRDGDRVRVTVELVHAPADRQLWAATFEREAGDVLAVQAEIARAVAREVRASLTASESARLTRPPKVDSQAYDLYLRGRYFFNREPVEGEAALRRSVHYLEQAIARDAKFAEAQASLSLSYAFLVIEGILPPWEGCPRQDNHARVAVQLDPDLADAHTAMASNLTLCHWDWPAGEAAFRRAIELNPGDAHARLWYGLLLLDLGRHAEALTQCTEGLRTDPFNPILLGNAAAVLSALGRHEEALRRQREIAELEPASWSARGMGWVYVHMGRLDDARAEFERAGHERGLAYVRARRGDLTGARALLRELTERAKTRYVSPLEFAELHGWLGENDLAFSRLEEAYHIRAPGLVALKTGGEFAPLRSDPRFAEMVRRLKLD
jgi:TolB-like protein/DNA-binding winged helix-turn-helix (wHTH) protein/Tfp pilus assembly protein PilF